MPRLPKTLKIPDHRSVFHDPELLTQMLFMRIDGYSRSVMARYFGVNRATIIHRCKALKVTAMPKDKREEEKKRVREMVEFLAKETVSGADTDTIRMLYLGYRDGIPLGALAERIGVTARALQKIFARKGYEISSVSPYEDIITEELNAGKSYADYLKENNRR